MIKNPKPKTPKRIRDGGGLYLEALQSGRKVWRLEYRSARGTKTRATFRCDYGKPGGSLAEARKWRDEQRAQIAKGVDPNRAAKQATANGVITFDAAADDWLDYKRSAWSAATNKKATGIVRRVLRPSLGALVVDLITPAHIQAALEPFDVKGQTESAHRACEYASAIFRRCALRGVVSGDPARPVRDTLRPNTHANHAHLTDPAQIGALMRAIDDYEGHFSVVYSLKLLPRLFSRPGELRMARWCEFDFDNRLWTIPAERMKARREHAVPLSTQVVGLLRELSQYAPRAPERLLFPSVRSNYKPITDSTVRASLRIMGFTNDQITPHGFRHTASTQLYGMGFESHVIERQLAHTDSNAIRGVYNKAEYWPQRAAMMQRWADYLDKLKG